MDSQKRPKRERVNQEYEELLFDLCPSLYKNRAQTGMTYGFCFSNGWFNIMLNLSIKLEQINKGLRPKAYLYQAKEKFGSLTVYAVDATLKMEDLIKEAEKESRITCEECGTKRKVSASNSGWIRTLCKVCMATYT